MGVFVLFVVYRCICYNGEKQRGKNKMYTQDDILNFIYNFKHRANKEKELEDVF